MTHSVVVMRRARSDLLRLNTFLAEKSERAARQAMDAIEIGLRSLSTLPTRHTADEDGMRRLNIRFGRSAYVVHYRAEDTIVVIARVFHMREDPN